jgi:hypothetical protein
MNTADAVYEYLKTEVLPMVSSNSEFIGGVLNGALRAGRKRLTAKLNDVSILHVMGLIKDNGEVDAESFREFASGMFEQKESIPVTLAEMLKILTGVDSDSDLLKSRLILTRADADKFLELLQR